MSASNYKSKLAEILQKLESEILADWAEEQLNAVGRRSDLIGTDDLKRESSEFLRLLQQTLHSEKSQDTKRPGWKPVRDWLDGLSHSRSMQGFSPSETASFIFSLKQPLFSRLRREYEGASSTALADEYWATTSLLDQLGLHTMETYQKAQQQVILRQQEDMMELSTPVVKLWEGILALPLIGTLDSARTQIVMESLLQRIVETGAEVAIIDITGVPTVDTLVAQHLLKTITAARLMGADCVISGIRPQIAATIVHLGVDLGNIVTKSNLADAFALALRRLELTVVRQSNRSAPARS
jgi:rsbT co-antagonist protein RsbR